MPEASQPVVDIAPEANAALPADIAGSSWGAVNRVSKAQTDGRIRKLQGSSPPAAQPLVPLVHFVHLSAAQ